MADVSVHLPNDLFENSQPFSPLNSDDCDQLGSPTTKTIVLRTLGAVPAGWLRKPVRVKNGNDVAVAVLYYNPSGKKFSSQAEVDQHFVRLGYAVCQGVFDFQVNAEDRLAVVASVPTQRTAGATRGGTVGSTFSMCSSNGGS
jgi:hypothetical protein